MYCGQCGKKVMENMLFCPFCGSPIVIPYQDEPAKAAEAARAIEARLIRAKQEYDEATFYDNENGFVAVAEYKNGEIMQIGSSKPQWLAELMEYVI